MISLRRVLAIGLIVIAAGFSVVNADDGYTPVSWSDYHWLPDFTSGGAPVTLDLHGSFSSATHDLWTGILQLPLNDWNTKSLGTLSLNAVLPGNNDPKKCPPTVGRIEVCSERFGGRWVGQAQVWASGVHITQATVKLNDHFLAGAEGSSIYTTADYRRMVLCHEVGHAAGGMGHPDTDFYNPNKGTCMDYTAYPTGNPPGTDMSNLLPHDHDGQMIWNYANVFHSGESTGGGGNDPPTCPGRKPNCANLPPPAMGQINFETPDQWGKLVSSSPDGLGQVFELDFGGGHRVITFVIWASPADARR